MKHRIPKQNGNLGSLFLDSGAHSLYNLNVRDAANPSYDYFDTKAFKRYMDKYARFVRKYGSGLDYYVNVDVIHDPERSWRNLKYLERKWGLSPVPVIHHKTPMKWVRRHLKEGYEFIGIGGVAVGSTQGQYVSWADEVFSILCDRRGFPKVRTHGFAMTSFRALRRYPWWSVDSASWVKAAGFGMIYVPHRRGGKFQFDVKPYQINVSAESLEKQGGDHVLGLPAAERRIIKLWLKEIRIPLGSVDERGELLRWGVVSSHPARKVANLRFYERLVKSLPKYPWAFKHQPQKGLLDI